MPKYIALDVGLKRIGMAFSDGNIVVPLMPILRRNRNQAARDVTNVLNEYDADILVVGLPIGGTSEDEMKRRISHFVSLLNFNKQIVYNDESFSSSEAYELSHHTSKDGKLDSIAAMIILQRYLKK